MDKIRMNKKDLQEMINQLENGVDKFIVAGLFYGLNGSDNREALLNITSDMIDLEKSTITLPSGRVVIMDEILKQTTVEAMVQKVYIKMGDSPNMFIVDYEFNEDNKYLIKVKPTKRNNNGLEPLTNDGFKKRVRKISEYLTGDSSAITPSDLKKAGAFDVLISSGQKLTLDKAGEILKDKGLSIRRNVLLEMLREIKGE